MSQSKTLNLHFFLIIDRNTHGNITCSCKLYALTILLMYKNKRKIFFARLVMRKFIFLINSISNEKAHRPYMKQQKQY
jgi:hypothetical protein